MGGGERGMSSSTHLMMLEVELPSVITVRVV